MKSQDEETLVHGDVPEAVLEHYQRAGGDPTALVTAVASDVAADGSYEEQWLLIDPARLCVFEVLKDQIQPRFCLELEQITAARIEQGVGVGLLEVTAEDKPRVVLHYTNELTETFARIAHYLNQRSTQDSVATLPDFGQEKNRCLSCGRRLLDPSIKVCPKCIQRGKVLHRLITLARPYWRRGLVHLGLMFIGIIVDLMPPYLTRTLIDQVLAPRDNIHLLTILVAGLLGLQVIRVVVTIYDSLLINRISSQFAAEVRQKMFAHLKSLPMEFFDRNEVGRLLTRINHDTEELQGLINQLASFLLSGVLVVGIGIVLFSMAPFLGLFVLIPAPFVIVATVVYQRYMHPHFRRYWVTRWRLNSMLSTFLTGIHVVKSFTQEDQEEARYTDRNTRVLDSQLRINLAWSRFFPLISFTFGAGGLLIWYAGGHAVLDDRITLGTLMAFLSYLGMFYGPLSNMAQISQGMNRFLTISQRIFEFFDEVTEAIPATLRRECRIQHGKIEFNHVTFGYDPYFPVLRDLTFTIEPGELIGIVGSSGAGKTTLANLICNFYTPTEGDIRVDGIDIKDLDDLRSSIGIVLQSPFLFRGTLAQNIAYGRPEATREEIIRAAKAANAHDFIIDLPEGYDTIVGEGGTGLSGGERQRISIARAILLNPRILILDEATSSVDTETERQIQEALDTVVQGRTTIAIAHRLSTLYNADRIIAMERGRIVEIGAPQELIEKKGLFYKLVQLQTQFARLDGVAAL